MQMTIEHQWTTSDQQKLDSAAQTIEDAAMLVSEICGEEIRLGMKGDSDAASWIAAQLMEQAADRAAEELNAAIYYKAV